MNRILIGMASLGLVLGSPAAAGQEPIEGRWTNPKHSVVVSVERCGLAWCGKVVEASDKAKANARKGGTPNLVGTEILSGLRPDGNGGYRGKVFVPKFNLTARATVRHLDRDTMLVKGCAVAGLLCDDQRWTRIEG